MSFSLFQRYVFLYSYFEDERCQNKVFFCCCAGPDEDAIKEHGPDFAHWDDIVRRRIERDVWFDMGEIDLEGPRIVSTVIGSEEDWRCFMEFSLSTGYIVFDHGIWNKQPSYCPEFLLC